MSTVRRLWTRMMSFAEAFDGVDDPVGDYILSLGKRVDKLENDLARLDGQRNSEAVAGMRQ
jgi:hypothetical protein